MNPQPSPEVDAAFSYPIGTLVLFNNTKTGRQMHGEIESVLGDECIVLYTFENGNQCTETFRHRDKDRLARMVRAAAGDESLEHEAPTTGHNPQLLGDEAAQDVETSSGITTRLGSLRLGSLMEED
jgi:hypothetical protein